MPDAVPGFIEALKLNEGRRQFQLAQRLAELKQQQENEHQQAVLEETKQFHKEENERLKAEADATIAAHKVTQQGELQRIGQNFQLGAPAPPGTSVIPDQPDSQGRDTILGISTPGETSTMPGMFTPTSQPITPMRVMSPEKYQDVLDLREQHKADIAQQKAQALEQQKADDALKKQKEFFDYTYKRIQEHDDNVAALRDAQIASNERIASQRTAAMLAKLDRSGSQITGDDVKTYLNMGVNGDITLPDLAKMIPIAKDREVVTNAAARAGVVFMDDKQKMLIGNFTPGFKAYEQAQQLLHILETDGTNAKFNPLTESFKEAHRLQAEIHEGSIAAAQAVGQQRLSDIRAKAMGDAYDPKFNPMFGSIKSNRKAAEDFKAYLLDTFNGKLSNLPENQRKLLVGRLQSSAAHEVGNTSTNTGAVMMTFPGSTTPYPVHPDDVQKAVQAGAKVVQ